MTEDQIRAALDGHFYRMFFGEHGVKVVDLEADTPPPKPETLKKTQANPYSIDWTNKNDQLILEMRRAGAQYKEIAAALGMNKDTVRWRFHRLCQVMGVDPDQEGPSYKKFNPRIEAEIVAARNSGRTYQSIGEQYGMSKAAVRSLYHRWYQRTHKEAA